MNQLRSHAGWSAFNFTVDPNPERNVTTVKAEHIRQLRTALEQARWQLGLSIGGYEHPTLTENSTWISAIDFQEIRNQILSAWNGGSSSVDIQWLVADQLGTPRMIIGKAGTLASVIRHDYLPFGEELFAATGGRTTALGYSNSDATRQKFSLKERDTETGLDYFLARYYSSIQGRFASSDQPFADQQEADPQSWNLYSYVGNNTLKYTDPLGLWKRENCDNGGQCWVAEDGDDYDSLAKATGIRAFILRDFFQGQATPTGQVFDVAGAKAWYWGSERAEGLAIASPPWPMFIPGGGGLQVGTRATTGLLSRMGSALGRLFGKGAGQAAESTAIKIGGQGLEHVVERHGVTGAQSAGKSIFNAGEGILSLIRQAESTAPVQQAGRQTFERIIDAGRTIGLDRATGQPTSVYTVITDSAGNLKTAFPGKP